MTTTKTTTKTTKEDKTMKTTTTTNRGSFSRAAIYAAHGIEFKAGKINSPLGWIAPLLVNGNAKLGKGVWTFSTLPGTGEYTAEINGQTVTVRGTCPCSCPGCYAQTGFYRMASTVRALALRTIIARDHLDFMTRAISAQIAAEGITLVRIHASGDFFSPEYVTAWREIARGASSSLFWSYTKGRDAERAFSDLENVNIVRSVIPGLGFNFGPCGYILRAYAALKEAGNSVHICRCGIDPDQHCVNCRGCSSHDFVLFVEHSTSYRAADDPQYDELRALVESQPRA